jgi:hypothetical protein
MASPVFTPGGQCSVRKPQNSTIPADAEPKLEIQTLSLPSTEAAQGAARPLPDTGEKDASAPSGRNTEMLPPDSYPGILTGGTLSTRTCFARRSSNEPAIPDISALPKPSELSRVAFRCESRPRAKVQLVSCAEFVVAGVFLGKNACRAVHLTFR